MILQVGEISLFYKTGRRVWLFGWSDDPLFKKMLTCIKIYKSNIYNHTIPEIVINEDGHDELILKRLCKETERAPERTLNYCCFADIGICIPSLPVHQRCR